MKARIETTKDFNLKRTKIFITEMEYSNFKDKDGNPDRRKGSARCYGDGSDLPFVKSIKIELDIKKGIPVVYVEAFQSELFKHKLQITNGKTITNKFRMELEEIKVID